MAKKGVPSSSTATSRALAPKLTVKDPSKFQTIEQKKLLLEKWYSHVTAYRQSLGTTDESREPKRADFEDMNDLGRGALGYLLKTSELTNMVPELSQGRKYAREEVRPFYPVEKIVVRLVEFLREQKVTVDVWLLRLLAMVVYEHLLAKFGEMTFEKPMFSNGWATNFMRFWGFGRHKLQGEAGAVNWSDIKEEVERLQHVISKYNMRDVYNADETGLFLQTASDWTIDITKSSGTKTSSTRVSILFCTNATGTDKINPFMLSTFL